VPYGAKRIGLAASALILVGCTTAQQHRAAVADPTSDRVTVGTVQREIRVGMSSADVVSVLGAPNIVTTDELRREQWVYDKIATETVYSGSQGGVNTLFLGGAIVGSGLLGGAAGAGYGAASGAQSTSQRTLTIIVKFDESQRVRDFAYRTSSF
jgi:outer membrane protein assembly factor BamE (lipoprotein component of BamABCDE complex)